MPKAEMPETYSGSQYHFTAQPTVRCPSCGKPRNRLQVHRVAGGGTACVSCLREGEPPLARSVVLWSPVLEPIRG